MPGGKNEDLGVTPGAQPFAEAGGPLHPIGADAAGLDGSRTLGDVQFFREAHHYSQLEIRARALSRRRTSLSLWCCGCGTGEDAYAAAMVLREAGSHGEVVATDAEGDALAAARRGMYRLADVRPLGEARLQRHFFVRGSEDADRVALVRGELRAMVRFVGYELAGGARLPGAPFDFIFCRSGLSVLDSPTRRRAIDDLAQALAPGGVLFLGQSESFGVAHPELLPCGRTAFERRSRGS